MTRKKAVLIFDPERRPEQEAYAAERAEVLHRAGDQLWVSITEAQVSRFAERGIVVQLHEDADRIVLPAVAFDPAQGEPEPPADLRAAAPSGDAEVAFLVQFVAPTEPEWLDEVAAAGGRIVQSLPVNVALVRLSADAAAAVRALPSVSWVGLFHPAYALGHALAGRAEPLTPAGLRTLAVDPGSLPPPADGNLQIRLMDDVDVAAVRELVPATGAEVVGEAERVLVLRAGAAAVPALLRLPGVLAVEPFYLPDLLSNRGGVIMGGERVRNFGNIDFLVNLDGAGEIAAVFDSGLGSGTLTPPAGTPPIHADVLARVLQVNNVAAPGTPVPDNAPHGTHVTGTIAGDGAGSGGRIRGMAPACRVIFHGPLRPPPGGATVDAVAVLRAAHEGGARVHNNSWGTRVSFVCPVPVTPNSWRYDQPTNNPYTAGTTDLLDRFCFTHPESLVVFAAGNQERDTQPAGGAGAHDMVYLNFEATGKNVLTVGAVENVRNNAGFRGNYRAFFNPAIPAGCPPDAARWNPAAWAALAGGPAHAFTMSDDADHVALFSCRGRVQGSGGRIKPDLVAPGTNILSLRSSQLGAATPPFNPVPAVANPNLYQWMTGTSMAAPHVSGAAVLVRQYYRSRFGQLRRPALLEAVPIPDAPAAPQPAFVDRPAATPHADGLVFAWLRPGLPADQKHIRAARLARDLTRVSAAVVQLQADVGEHPAPMLARHGEATLLLHRHGDASVRVSRYQRDLTAEAGFGTGGVQTLAPLSRLDDERPPALLVAGDQVGVAWADATADRLLFQRLDATTGAPIDAAAVALGPMIQASPRGCLAHNGNRFAAAWVNQQSGNHRLHVRLVSEAGAPVGAQPRTILQQAQEIRDPHLLWDPRHDRFVLAWCDSRAQAGGQLYRRFLDANGAPQGAEELCMSAPAATTVRRPRLALHPGGGYVLLWEDDSQTNRHDVYLAMLGDNGLPDGRIPADASDPPSNRRLLRISDTPEDTGGYAAVVSEQGITVAWQSGREINSRVRGAYVVNVTLEGAFQAQVDPNTPLLHSGRYVNHRLVEHASVTQDRVSSVWAGGPYYLARSVRGAFLDELQLVRTNADGLVDSGFGAGGARVIQNVFFSAQVELHWTGTVLAALVVEFPVNPRLYLFDAAGAPRANFGTGGVRELAEPDLVHTDISPQLAHITVIATRYFVVYGVGAGGAERIRYAVVDGAGGVVLAPRDLTTASGTARHGWYHFVRGANQSIAAWHRAAGAITTVFVNRYDVTGSPQHTPDPRLTTAPGEARNAAIAPRPVAVNSAQREYGVVWQYRETEADPWEVRFSRLDPDGRVRPNPPAPAPPFPCRDIRVISPVTGDWPPDTHALEPQLVSTFTHHPWANPPTPLPAGTSLPEWSPGYGLAWLGQPTAGGERALYFTVLDENGARARLPQPPPNPHADAEILRVSDAGADVQEFELIWNGRSFRLTWTEVEGTNIRHMQTALTRYGARVVFEQPSAALLRATLINGATNIERTRLPNLDHSPAPNLNNGYGWGRTNLVQSLAPPPPATFHVRDDCTVGPGRSAIYRLHLPPATALLRVTLCWTDPPGAALVNRLHLRVTAPPAGGAAAQVYHGNTWQAAPNGRLSRPVAPGDGFQTVHNTEQVVIENPPAGDYQVEVIGELSRTEPFNQFDGQHFSLVFVGSGQEARFGGLPPAGIPIY